MDSDAIKLYLIFLLCVDVISEKKILYTAVNAYYGFGGDMGIIK